MSQWQGRIDGDFPRGVLMVWEGEDPEGGSVYRVPSVQVLRVVDDFPVVHFETIEEKDFVLQATSYEQVRDRPKVVRVAFLNTEQVALWSANVSDELAAVFEKVREERS